MAGLTAYLEGKIAGSFSRNGGFALAIARAGKKNNHADPEGQNAPSHESTAKFHGCYTNVSILNREWPQSRTTATERTMPAHPSIDTAPKASAGLPEGRITAIVPARNEEQGDATCL